MDPLQLNPPAKPSNVRSDQAPSIQAGSRANPASQPPNQPLPGSLVGKPGRPLSRPVGQSACPACLAARPLPFRFPFSDRSRLSTAGRRHVAGQLGQASRRPDDRPAAKGHWGPRFGRTHAPGRARDFNCAEDSASLCSGGFLLSSDPRGWFWSGQVKPGQVRSGSCLGQPTSCHAPADGLAVSWFFQKHTKSRQLRRWTPCVYTK